MAAPAPGTFTSLGDGGQVCGIRPDGSLACWGGDTGSRLPAGPFADVDPPCALRTDGTIACWGDEANAPSGRFRAISADSSDLFQACAVRDDGSLTCWGEEARVVPGRFVDVSLGAQHGCGVHEDGTIACWGDLTDGDFGQTKPPDGVYTTVASGDTHSCALRPNGLAVCWGDNSAGQASPPHEPFTSISAGGMHTCATRTDGSVRCWGDDSAGQISLEAGAMRTAPTLSPNVMAVSVGEDGQVCAINPDSSLTCWGQNAPPPRGRFVAVATGASEAVSCAIRVNGSLVCWGAGDQPRPPRGRFTAVDVDGSGDACAVRVDGRVLCWGADAAPATAAKYTAVRADSGAACGLRTDGYIACWSAEPDETETPAGTFVSFAGSWPLCGLRADGSVACAEDAGSPFPRGTFTAIDVGWVACGLRTDGEIACGEAEEDTAALHAIPTGPFAALSLGADGGCAIRKSGELAWWGTPGSVVAASWPSVQFADSVRRRAGSPISLRWTASSPVSTIASYDVRYRKDAADGSWTTWSSGQRARAASIAVKPFVLGALYEVQVRARATDGQLSAWATSWVTTPDDDAVLHAGRGWARVRGSAYYGGSALSATRRGARLTLPNIGATNLDLVATTCPSCGTIRVSIRRTKQEEAEADVSAPEPVTISLRSSHRVDRRILDAFFDDSDPAIVGTLVIEVVSRGRPVIIDGVLIE